MYQGVPPCLTLGLHLISGSVCTVPSKESLTSVGPQIKIVIRESTSTTPLPAARRTSLQGKTGTRGAAEPWHVLSITGHAVDAGAETFRELGGDRHF